MSFFEQEQTAIEGKLEEIALKGDFFVHLVDQELFHEDLTDDNLTHTAKFIGEILLILEGE